MTTGDNFVNIVTKRLMGFLDFRDRLLDYVRKQLGDVHSGLFQIDGFIGTPVTISAFGNDAVQIDNDILGTDAIGHFLQTNADLAGRTSGVLIENTAAVTYYIGLQYAERPRGIQINPRTMLPEFISLEETIGVRDEPDAVVDNGGTITFTVDSVARQFPDDVSNNLTQTGREVVVWKKVPAAGGTTELVAVETCTIFQDAGSNKITTTGVFGQSTVSTVTTDYFVLLLGPTITRAPTAAQAGVLHVGSCVGTGAGSPPGTFSTAGQSTLGTSAIDLGLVTASHHGNLKILVTADASDTNETQVEVRNDLGSKVFGVDEDGDTEVFGTFISRTVSALWETLTLGATFNAGTPAQAATPRIDFSTLNPAAGLNALMRWASAAATFRTFGLGSGGGGYWATINAQYDDTVPATPWAKDAGGEPSYGLEYVRSGAAAGFLRIWTMDAGSPGPWLAWDNKLLEIDLVDGSFINVFPTVKTPVVDFTGSIFFDKVVGFLDTLSITPPDPVGGSDTLYQFGGTNLNGWVNESPLAPLTVDGDISSVAGAVDAQTSITAQTGNIEAVAGDVVAGANVSAVGNVTGAEHIYGPAKTFYHWVHGFGGTSRSYGLPGTGTTGPETTLAGTISAWEFDDTAGGNSVNVSYPVHLPQGAVITGIELFGINSGNATSVSVNRQHRDGTRTSLDTGGFSNLLSSNFDSTAAGVGVNVIGGALQNNTIDNANYQYQIQTLMTSLGSPSFFHVHGFMITYTLANIAS